MSITTNVVLEPVAAEFAYAITNPPYLFDRGPVERRRLVDGVQSGEIEKPDVEIHDTTIPGGLGGEVSIGILRATTPAHESASAPAHPAKPPRTRLTSPNRPDR
jgi:hypothetical protein